MSVRVCAGVLIGKCVRVRVRVRLLVHGSTGRDLRGNELGGQEDSSTEESYPLERHPHGKTVGS